jgi:hypothetical protein
MLGIPYQYANLGARVRCGQYGDLSTRQESELAKETQSFRIVVGYFQDSNGFSLPNVGETHARMATKRTITGRDLLSMRVCGWVVQERCKLVCDTFRCRMLQPMCLRMYFIPVQVKDIGQEALP